MRRLKILLILEGRYRLEEMAGNTETEVADLGYFLDTGEKDTEVAG